MAATAPAPCSLHLRLQVEPSGQAVSGLLISPSGTTLLPPIHPDPAGDPGHLQALLQKWQRANRACYVLELPDAQPLRVQECAEELRAALRSCCISAAWAPLLQALAQYPALPLVLEIVMPTVASAEPQPASTWWDALPWEQALSGLTPQGPAGQARPIWRVRSLPCTSPPAAATHHPRRPRLLLLRGPDKGLQLEPQLTLLRRLQRHGRIVLHELDSCTCRSAAVLERLADPRGWDAFLYLGHGEPGATYGGGLTLASGELLAGDRLRLVLRKAAPQLMLLSRCFGTDLVPLCLEAGVPWVLAFRGEVPDPIALAAFTPFWEALERGGSLAEASASAAQALEEHFPGSSSLLTLVARPDAQPLRLPLRRRRRWRLRLARSQRRQGYAAAAVLTLALVLYGPSWGAALTLPNVLLDLRLQAQTQWRRWRRPGPALPPPAPGLSPLRVWLLSRSLAYPEGPSQRAVSRQVLRQLLQALPADTSPLVAFDVVLDRGQRATPVQPQATADLARLLASRRASGQRLLTITYPSNTAGRSAQGVQSHAAPVLLKAGLCQTEAGLGLAAAVFPLQLAQPLRASSFAAALADGPGHPCPPLTSPSPIRIPAGSVVDWTLDWFSPQVMTVERIDAIPAIPPALPAGTRLLIGVDHRLVRAPGPSEPLSPNEEADLFEVPLALRDQPSFETEIGLGDPLPGPLLQAVLSESLRRRHWLTPLALLPTTALAAGLGLLLAAALERRRSRLLVLCLLSALALPLGLELALTYQLLVPLLLPLAGLWATCLSRREAPR
jgi:hypothetical protein